MKNHKNRLDEMQEQKLLHIEHNGCWLAFWGMLAAMLVQLFVYGREEAADRIIGEWIVFMCLAVYIVVDCLRNGIWDRKSAPTPKANAYYSLAAGIAVGVIYLVVTYQKYHVFAGSIATAVFMGGMAFAICFVGMTLLAAWHVRRENRIENAEEKEERNPNDE
ncbi:MAG: hypothetical protein NC321_01840 [Clostridium sp.]|nr:hypothetical protein [Lachnoclostridium sp.]MCM1251535.1 hypothetical protein [Clostridium sp.]